MTAPNHETHSSNPFEDIAKRLAGMFEAAPPDALKANAQAWFSARLRELDLVTREEFDLQTKLLARANAKLTELEAAITKLESR